MTCRKAIQLTSKPDSVVDPGQIQTVPVYGLGGVRRRGCVILIQALVRNVGTCWFNVKGREEAQKSSFASTKVNQRDGATRSSDEACESKWSEGVALFSQDELSTGNGRSS